MKGFKRFELPPFLLEALEKQHIHQPADIQERLIPAVLNKRDVIGQSQTGTGKTLAFLLPVAARIDPEKHHVQAVILAPTRELASQLHQELKKLLEVGEGSRISAKTLIGGTDRQKTVEQFQQPPHIVTATPGRLKDMTDSGVLDVSKAEMLVVDEADQMLDMGFIEEIDPVASKMPETLQMLVFSATIPEALQPFLKKYMSSPRHVHVRPEEASPAVIDHYFIPIRHRNRTELTIELALRLQPYFAIIFTSTKEEADEMAEAMSMKGIHADTLHGDISPRRRKQVMRNIDKLDVQYLVATDLAARGMDIEGVSHIINHSLPKELGYYVHRAGRTGRAGADGEVYTLIDEQSEYPRVSKLQDQSTPCTFIDFKKGEFTLLDNPLKKAAKKKNKSSDTDAAVKKPKKVKPGYKKKAAQQPAGRQNKKRRK
ncbi:DEAD/DEAH box helicase [Salibacterium qingdaonense]|uniref:ATP-dependent RNA helicase CshB n=1 Tax=Salibacterium qingdaonense TaxID=266892 RepID=A0A1I4JJM7_9BACI|nr:DEAD/DEAH box helicase [Salibacterium qingdaonense]SFL66788.1 ATP-dependent RNA helicase CshB [Salibacterium qingdaonense]